MGTAVKGHTPYLGDVFATQKLFVCLKEALKQTFYSLLTSDMLDIESNSVEKPALLSNNTPLKKTAFKLGS